MKWETNNKGSSLENLINIPYSFIIIYRHAISACILDIRVGRVPKSSLTPFGRTNFLNNYDKVYLLIYNIDDCEELRCKRISFSIFCCKQQR